MFCLFLCNFQSNIHTVAAYVGCPHGTHSRRIFRVVKAWCVVEIGLASLKRTRLQSARSRSRCSTPTRQALHQSVFGFRPTDTRQWLPECGLQNLPRPNISGCSVLPLWWRRFGEVTQLIVGIVKLKAVHASEAVAEAEIQRAHELVVARVGDTCPSAVRPAISGMTVAAENTIDQTNRQIEFPKLDLGDMASPFIVYHATM